MSLLSGPSDRLQPIKPLHEKKTVISQEQDVKKRHKTWNSEEDVKIHALLPSRRQSRRDTNPHALFLPGNELVSTHARTSTLFPLPSK